MRQNSEEINFFGQTVFHKRKTTFGIRNKDRWRPMHIIGQAKKEKTKLIYNMAIQDIQQGNGVAIFDGEGELAEKCLKGVPKNRINETIYFNPSDLDFPIALNVLRKIKRENYNFVITELLNIFNNFWEEEWDWRWEYLLKNSLLALLEYPSATLLGINRMIGDKNYREKVIKKITNQEVKEFWEKDFIKYQGEFLTKTTLPLQKKLKELLEKSNIKNIIGQSYTAINFKEILEEKKILIVNVSRKKIGRKSSKLLSLILKIELYLSALEREEIPELEREDFFLFSNEEPSFTDNNFNKFITQAGKYRLNLILSYQKLASLKKKVQQAILFRPATILSFKVGILDGELLAKKFTPIFLSEDFINLSENNFILTLVINGVPCNPFIAKGLAWLKTEKRNDFSAKIIQVSRERYATPRKKVERKINDWLKEINVKVKNEIKELANNQSEINKQLFSKEDIHLKSKRTTKRQDNKEKEISYPTHCWSCKKFIQLPFQPDGQRPVFCKDCLREYRRQKALVEVSSKVIKGENNKDQSGKTKRNNNMIKQGRKITKLKRKKVNIDKRGLKLMIKQALNEK